MDVTTKAADTTEIDSTLPASLVNSVAVELRAIRKGLTSKEIHSRLDHAEQLLRTVYSQLTADRAAVEAAEGRIRQLLMGDVDSAPAAAALVESIAQLSEARSGRIGQGFGPEPSSTGSAPAQALTAAEVTSYLRDRRPNSTDHAVDVRVLAGGYSKVTTLVTCVIDGREAHIVLRQVPKGRSPRSLIPEFEVVKHVHANGLPVPRPLWIEPGDNPLGGAFFATEQAPGENIGDVWGQAGASTDLCLEIAHIYAALHGLPTDGLQTPVSPRSTPEELGAMIAWQQETLHKRGIRIEPTLAALFAWLEAHIPSEPPRKALIHGDAAFSNLLVLDSHVSAVLDWESAHIGDPAEELAYLRPSIEPVMPWRDFVKEYVSAGGTEPSPGAMKFFEVWSHVWRHIGCLWLSQNYALTGRYASAVAAYVHGPRFLARAVGAAFETMLT
jgi:aminoglycoside phosphotransferase (APT) family kinase protein